VKKRTRCYSKTAPAIRAIIVIAPGVKVHIETIHPIAIATVVAIASILSMSLEAAAALHPMSLLDTVAYPAKREPTSVEQQLLHATIDAEAAIAALQSEQGLLRNHSAIPQQARVEQFAQIAQQGTLLNQASNVATAVSFQ